MAWQLPNSRTHVWSHVDYGVADAGCAFSPHDPCAHDPCRIGSVTLRSTRRWSLAPGAGRTQVVDSDPLGGWPAWTLSLVLFGTALRQAAANGTLGRDVGAVMRGCWLGEPVALVSQDTVHACQAALTTAVGVGVVLAAAAVLVALPLVARALFAQRRARAPERAAEHAAERVAT